MLGRHSLSVGKKPRTTWACDQWEQWTQNNPKLMAAGVMSQLPLEYLLQDLHHPEKQKQLFMPFLQYKYCTYSNMYRVSIKV